MAAEWGGGGVVGWLNTRMWDQTHDERRSQGWTALVLDTNGNGKRDAYLDSEQKTLTAEWRESRDFICAEWPCRCEPGHEAERGILPTRRANGRNGMGQRAGDFPAASRG
jgi:hypothetical protein